MVDRETNLRPSQLNTEYPYNQARNQPNTQSKDDAQPIEINRTDTMLAGYLMKRGALLNRWSQRYFMLDGRYLDQFKSEKINQTSKHSKRIDLLEYQVRSLSPSSHSRPFCFALQPVNSNNQSYLFSARSERERCGWVDSINSAIRSVKQSNKQATVQTVIGPRDQCLIQTGSLQSLNECTACHTSTSPPSPLTQCETCNQSFCSNCLAHSDDQNDSLRPNQCQPCFRKTHQQPEQSVRTTQRRSSDQSINRSMLQRRGSDVDDVMSDSSVEMGDSGRSSSLVISIPSTNGNRLNDPLLTRSSSDNPVLIVSEQAEQSKELVSPVPVGCQPPPNTPIPSLQINQPLSPISPIEEHPSLDEVVTVPKPNLKVVIPLDTTPSIKIMSNDELRRIEKKKRQAQSLRSPRSRQSHPWWMCWA